MITNRFLRDTDMDLLSLMCIKKELEEIYEKRLRRRPVVYGQKHKGQSKMQWSRDWEYPWAIISSLVKKGEKVLDCGCDNSPLLPFLSLFGCQAYGIDPEMIGRKRLSDIFNNSFKGDVGSFPRRFWRFLKEYHYSMFERHPVKLGFNIKFYDDDIADMRFENEFFDKVYCISVIEHLSKETAFKGMEEMSRVLKKGGLLTVTIDNDGSHVNPDLAGRYEDLIRASGLELYGMSDLSIPREEQMPGKYNVLGFVLKK